MNLSPGIIAMYATLAWIVLSIPAGVLIGRGIRLADRASTAALRTLAHTCPCGGCS